MLRPISARFQRRVVSALAEDKAMRLIVGLGNPDPEYQWTPHNLGFMAVDELADRGSIRVERPEGKALVGRGTSNATGRRAIDSNNAAARF